MKDRGNTKLKVAAVLLILLAIGWLLWSFQQTVGNETATQPSDSAKKTPHWRQPSLEEHAQQAEGEGAYDLIPTWPDSPEDEARAREESAKSEARASAREAVPPGPEGTVKGRVRFTGTEPPPRALEMDKDPTCLRQLDRLLQDGRAQKLPARLVYSDGAERTHHVTSWSTEQEIEEVDLVLRGNLAQRDVLVTDGALADVVVWVEDLPAERDATPGELPAQLDQQRCLFEPFVLGVQVGQQLEIKNSDPSLHNVHAFAEQGEFNVAMPKPSSRIMKRFKAPQVFVRITCELHPWMQAYAAVVPHHYYAVTGADGAFTLPVPVGKHTLAFEHPILGRKTRAIEVTEGGSLEVEEAFAAKP